MNNIIKWFFYKKNIQKNWITSDDEAMKQWVIKQDISKILNKDIGSLEKAQTAINDMLKGKIAKSSDYSAFLEIRKKYNSIFKENANELYNPTMRDIHMMNSISIDEINETMDDRKRILFRNYYNSIVVIYRSSQNGLITTPT